MKQMGGSRVRAAVLGLGLAVGGREGSGSGVGSLAPRPARAPSSGAGEAPAESPLQAVARGARGRVDVEKADAHPDRRVPTRVRRPRARAGSLRGRGATEVGPTRVPVLTERPERGPACRIDTAIAGCPRRSRRRR
jgi:hypothetical protein